LDPSGLWHLYRLARLSRRGDFRGSRWGASTHEAEQSEVEGLREDWSGLSTLYGFEVLFRYEFGPAGLRSGTYEFRLQMSEIDPAAAFQQVLDVLLRHYGLPAYLQQAPALLASTPGLTPTSLLRFTTRHAGRCMAAWATQATEILLLKDETAVPLRLRYQARDPSLYPEVATQAMRALQLQVALQ
jgi:hypothetical protein